MFHRLQMTRAGSSSAPATSSTNHSRRVLRKRTNLSAPRPVPDIATGYQRSYAARKRKAVDSSLLPRSLSPPPTQRLVRQVQGSICACLSTLPPSRFPKSNTSGSSFSLLRMGSASQRRHP
jgi:hypothetical protein